MDTLIIPASRRRGYALVALAVVLVAVAVLSDDAGRLLAAPAAVGALVIGVLELRGHALLRADGDGVQVQQGLRLVRAAWSDVERMRVVRDRRTELLELDLGRTLVLLPRHRLGRLPDDVLTELVAVRAAAGAPPTPHGA